MNVAALALVIIAGIAVTAPIVSAIIVSVASRRDDARWTLDRPVCRRIEATARHILGFSFDSEWPQAKERTTQPKAALMRK